MESSVIFCGSGGQGILLVGTVLCHAGLKENKNVTWLPSYGAEKRGGLSYCAVVISDEEIASPILGSTPVIVALDNIGLDVYEKALMEKGLIILNSSLIKRQVKRTDAEIIAAPISDIAKELGNAKISNMVALGIYLGRTNTLKIKSAFDALSEVAASKYKELVAINIEALEKGFEIGKNKGK